MSTLERNGLRTIGFDLGKSAIKELKGYWKAYARKIDPFPNIFAGRGIVICAGGLRYFTCGWVTIKMLRRNGCKLPIELWHLGSELSAETIAEIEKFGVTCKNILDYGPTSLTGVMLKPLCIIKSSFKEVLFMDADNICVKDPTELFETAEYLEYGAVFWPDFWQTPADNPIWAITETPYIASKEQESGQLLINKERVWKELNLSLHFNELSNIYHRLLMGDKDTFRFAWLALKTPFFMTPEEPAVCGYPDSNNTFLGTTMIQHDRKGDFYFLHRNLLKWDVTRIGEKVWTSIKKFSPQTPGKEYIFSVSANGHCYMDLVGKVNVTDFSIVFPGFEEICMEYLEGLRSSGFYHRFLTYSHFAAHRYPKETLFSLDSPL